MNDKSIYSRDDIPVLDGEEWLASQAIDDNNAVISCLLGLAKSCIELKIKLEESKKLLAELSLQNATHNIELETDAWFSYCASLSETEISEMANAAEDKLNIFVAKYLK